jgi:glycosyltransferase involved in cell wall biosynthesis
MDLRPPLVSAVMVTRGRPGFVRQSIRYFVEQDYPEKELLIVHEDESDLPALLPEDARIRTLRVERGLSIGEKRNIGAEGARGELVALWDDDDWHAPGRLSSQAAPLLDGTADMSGLEGALFFELPTWTFWSCRPSLFSRMFVEGVLAGALMFRRRVWASLAKFPPTSLREDADFMVAAMRGGARLVRLPARDIYIYVRHGGNTWQFEPGKFLSPGAWTIAAEPFAFTPVRAFYLDIMRRSREPHRGDVVGPGLLVSCIMPTHDRREFVARSVRHFMRQRHAASELVVVDDGPVSVEDLLPASERIKYLRLPGRASIGQKRNLACERASGAVIVHWDDDDWMAPDWIDVQAGALLGRSADAVGLRRPYFYDPVRRRAWRYEYSRQDRPWLHGGTLCYPKSLWRKNPFPDTSRGEDTRFLWGIGDGKIIDHGHADKYVAYVHAKNASPKPGAGTEWRPCPPEEVERLWVSAARGASSARAI